MVFRLDTNVMRDTFRMGTDDDDLSLEHNTKLFKLFPFTTRNEKTVVEKLDCAVGEYLRTLLSQAYVELNPAELKETILKELNIEAANQPLFGDIVNSVCFRKSETGLHDLVRPLNLKMFSYVARNSKAEENMAQYLSSVLAPREQVQAIISDAIDCGSANENVLEGIFRRALPPMSQTDTSSDLYYPVFTAGQDLFVQDLRFILQNTSRSKEYLVELLEFYCFFYTSQTCLQLGQFLNGKRQEVVPLYYSLDWEKTSQGRKCYTDGWKVLEPAVNPIFFHAVALEILNQRESDERYDYIGLRGLLDQNPDSDKAIATEIRKCTELYCKAGKQDPPSGELSTSEEVQFLFNSIKKVIDESGRRGVDKKYSDKFYAFCKKHFLKFRGNSGSMLTLTERKLIFLTKLCIGSEKKMRLTRVFAELERRGVFLDESSKDAVMHYYERLNLIEKKSDSGDAQYVKRIL